MKLDDSQQAAVRHAVSDGRLKIITGGAGTGKTTIIKAALEEMKVGSLLAPTGKAAARLREASGIPAATIHSYLGWTGEGGGFERPDGNTISEPLVIDEASMIDSALLAGLLKFKPPKLILVGDSAQLPPVGKGQPFHDLCSRRPDLVARLTTCHRAKGAVHAAAQLIREGKVPRWEIDGDGESWRIFDTGKERETQAAFMADYVRTGIFDPTQDVVLAARNGESDDQHCTVRGLNHEIVRVVNPRGESAESWHVGDRVMNLKNNKPLDWYNGDIGEITAIDGKKNLWVRGDRAEDMKLDAEARRNLTHAYAMTVHKSQGSQYRDVYIMVHVSSSRMLNRNLIYTAVTRARRKVIVMGQPGALYSSLVTVPFRMTVLQKLIEQQAIMEIPL